MSSTAVRTVASGPPRVREQARDAVIVMAFSAGTSVALAAAIFLLTRLGR